MRKQLAVLAILLLTAGSAGATSLDLSFDNNAAQIAVNQPLVTDELGASRFGARFLYNGDEKTRLGSAGFEFVGTPGNVPGLNLGVGVKGYGGRTSRGQDLLNGAIGAVADYTPPLLGGVVFGAKLYVAPKIFSGLDSDGLLETSMWAGYRVTPKIEVYLGYQNIRSDFGRYGTWTIDEGLRLGFKATF